MSRRRAPLLTRIEEEKRATEAARAEEQRAAEAAKARNEAELAKREADEAAWSRAQAADSLAGYSAYLSQQPNGAFVMQASDRRDSLQREEAAWTQARDADEIQAYQNYLAAFPQGTRREDARSRIAELNALVAEKAKAEAEAAAEAQAKAAAEAEARRQAAREAAQAQEQASWAAAEQSDSLEGYRRYLEAYGIGVNADVARSRMAALEQQARDTALRAERQAWAAAISANSLAAYQAYLEQFPDGEEAASAQARIDELVAPVVTETNGRYVARRNANVRSKPSRDGVVLGGLKTGNEVEVTARVAVAGETWLRIDRGGREAFVYGTLLREMPREEIIAWNELRIVLDETFGDSIPAAEKVAAISEFLKAHPQSHHVPEAEAEREAYRAETAREQSAAAAQSAAAG